MLPIADSLRVRVEHRDHTRVARNPSNQGLAELQALIYRLVTSAEGFDALVAAGELDALEDLIEGDDRMTAAERLEIYGRAYFSRIIDALKKDFPATLGIVGAGNFHDLVVGYLAEYPPTQPSISHAGRYLPDYLRAHPLQEQWPFISELAHLECTLLEVFQAADADLLNMEQMRQIPPAQWPEFAVCTPPALAIIDCKWRVDEMLREFESNPGDCRELDAIPANGQVAILVWRKNSRVYYRAVEPVERTALMLARSGAQLSSIYEAIIECWGGIAQADAVERLMHLMTQWIEDGLLAPANSSLR
jgi:hypothetical protein